MTAGFGGSRRMLCGVRAVPSEEWSGGGDTSTVALRVGWLSRGTVGNENDDTVFVGVRDRRRPRSLAVREPGTIRLMIDVGDRMELVG